MRTLSRVIAEGILARVTSLMKTLSSPTSELRCIYHGPPQTYLLEILGLLASRSSMDVTGDEGLVLLLPVLLPVDVLPLGAQNPAVGSSGICDDAHILALRNTPACPQYLVLVPPARQSMLSITNAGESFGVAGDATSGSASIEEWLSDAYVQSLIDSAIGSQRLTDELQARQARNLLEAAVRAADDADQHDIHRPSSWAVLARVMESLPRLNPCTQWSLACGFPPVASGNFDESLQKAVLAELADALANNGFGVTNDRLKQNAEPADLTSIDECLRHLRQSCEVVHALTRGMPYYFAPTLGAELEDPPAWWLALTAEKLTALLEGDNDPDDAGELRIVCENAIVQAGRGLPSVVLAEPRLRIDNDAASINATAVTLTRESGARTRRVWELKGADASVTDADAIAHSKPLRYVAAGDGLTAKTARVVSLASWEFGVVVACRSAQRLDLPKRARKGSSFAYECFLSLIGEGRHYLDIFVRREVSPVQCTGYDVASAGGDELSADLSASAAHSGGVWGIEILATVECYYDLELRSDDGEIEVLRINITCEDAPPEGCAGEFDRLIRLNRAGGGRTTSLAVQVDRRSRVADIQAWVIDDQNVGRSGYPLVIAPDCTDYWPRAEWIDGDGTILSRGRFLHDPRPTFGDFVPPHHFTEARAAIAGKIRGNDGHGVIEAAELGAWLADPEFASDVDAYVGAYLRWLKEEPEIAVWTDIVFIAAFEPDQQTLMQEPEALMVSPMHPLRIGWHALAQRVLRDAIQAQKHCPAASILDPDSLPDLLQIPLRTATGSVKFVQYVATECGSDYWSILWNASQLNQLSTRAGDAPFDGNLGLRLGGVSSGFSASQVRKSLDDVASLLASKATLNVLVTSTSGHSDACNTGLLEWSESVFGERHSAATFLRSLGKRRLQVFDERKKSAQPNSSAIAQIAEESGGAVQWFGHMPEKARPDLGVIAQLESSNAHIEPTKFASPLGTGALLRHRIRRQLAAGAGAFLSESRVGQAGPPSGDALADKVMLVAAHLESLGGGLQGYTFAPSVQAIRGLLESRCAEFVAVSSSAVDPACFLGGWLDRVYLWDYDLPSYSHRAGDTNGYYLLSRIKAIDTEALQRVLNRLPDCDSMDPSETQEILLEVSRRGIPTVRGLSAGNSGAAGDLGLFLAGRFLQDAFRADAKDSGLLHVLSGDEQGYEVSLVVPVDPFQGYLKDLQGALAMPAFSRPDLLVIGIQVTPSSVHIKATPVEVKLRQDLMLKQPCREALSQARALSDLLSRARQVAEASGVLLWKLAFQHLLLSMIDFGFRVYSQQESALRNPSAWADLHQQVSAAILSDATEISIDPVGRLIVFDGSPASAPRDCDDDGVKETIVVGRADSSALARGDAGKLLAAARVALGDWNLMPHGRGATASIGAEASDGEFVQVDESPPKPEQAPTTVRGRFELAQEAAVSGNFEIIAAKWDGSDDHNPANDSSPQPNEPIELAHVSEPAPVYLAQRPEKHIDGISVLVGRTVDDFVPEKVFLSPSLTRLNQLNMGIVGDLGTGKTQLVKSLILQISRSEAQNAGVKPRFLIFDYKNDYTEASFVQAVGAKIVKPHHLPLNIFDTTNVRAASAPWMSRFKFFSDVLDKIYSNVGPVQQGNLKQAVRDANSAASSTGRQPTIYDVHDHYRLLVRGKQDAPLSIIGDMVDYELFSPTPAIGASFAGFMDGVTVIALNELGQDDRTKNMIVAIVLNLFYESMLQTPKRPFRGTSPQLRTVDSYLLVDEADNIMQYEFDVLKKLLLQGREFGVGVILASQYLKHFKVGATDYREPLLSWFIHKVPNISAIELTALGIPEGSAQAANRIQRLENHEFLFKTVDFSGAVVKGKPFYEILADESSLH